MFEEIRPEDNAPAATETVDRASLERAADIIVAEVIREAPTKAQNYERMKEDERPTNQSMIFEIPSSANLSYAEAEQFATPAGEAVLREKLQAAIDPGTMGSVERIAVRVSDGALVDNAWTRPRG